MPGCKPPAARPPRLATCGRPRCGRAWARFVLPARHWLPASARSCCAGQAAALGPPQRAAAAAAQPRPSAPLRPSRCSPRSRLPLAALLEGGREKERADLRGLVWSSESLRSAGSGLEAAEAAASAAALSSLDWRGWGWRGGGVGAWVVCERGAGCTRTRQAETATVVAQGLEQGQEEQAGWRAPCCRRRCRAGAR
jgi:hypothetical protein